MIKGVIGWNWFQSRWREIHSEYKDKPQAETKDPLPPKEAGGESMDAEVGMLTAGNWGSFSPMFRFPNNLRSTPRAKRELESMELTWAWRQSFRRVFKRNGGKNAKGKTFLPWASSDLLGPIQLLTVIVPPNFLS